MNERRLGVAPPPPLNACNPPSALLSPYIGSLHRTPISTQTHRISVRCVSWIVCRLREGSNHRLFFN